MGSEGAADRGVAIGVEGRILGHRDDQLTVFVGNGLEDRPLHELDIGHAERSSRPLRGERVAIARGDLHRQGVNFRLREERVPSGARTLSEGCAQHRVHVLRGRLVAERRFGEDGRLQHLRHIGCSVEGERLAVWAGRIKHQPHGHQNRRNRQGRGLCPSLCRIFSGQRHPGLSHLGAERRHRALSISGCGGESEENDEQETRTLHQETMILDGEWPGVSGEQRFGFLSAAVRPIPSAGRSAMMRAIRLAAGVPPLRAGMRRAPLDDPCPALRSG